MKRRVAVAGMLAAVVALESGCVFYAETQTREVPIAIEESAPVDTGAFLGWDVTSQMAPDLTALVVTVARRDACVRFRHEAYDEIETLETTLWTPPIHVVDVASAVVLGFAMAFAMPVTVVTGIVTETRSVIHGEHVTRKDRALVMAREPCEQAGAKLTVALVLPSGAALSGTTDHDGRIGFAIADTEPDAGTAIARIGDATLPLAYYRTIAACTRARKDGFARARNAPDAGARQQQLRALPTECGDPRSRAWSLVSAAVGDALALRCDAVAATVTALRAADPPLAASMLAAEPAVKACLDGTAAARARHAKCIELRSVAMLRAQQIGDVEQRARELQSLPRCDGAS